jgi:hypothetical protein
MRAELKRSVVRGPNGGRRPGAGRPKGAKNKIKTSDAHVSALSRPWTARVLHDACLLAFGTDDPEKPASKKLMTKDPWLRLAIWKIILDRAWGRAPMEVRFDVTKNVNVKYSREQLAKLSLEQISAIWREQIAAPAGTQDRQREPNKTGGATNRIC